MFQRSCWILVVISCVSGSGCLTRQVARDGDSFRNIVNDLYTNQAMDNLIRARRNMPFVQLTYSQLDINDSQELNIQSTISQTVGAALGFSAAGEADRKRVMSFTANPVTDQNDIYLKYLTFARNPELLVECDSPPCGAVHIMKKCGKQYYWVPCEAGPAFQELVMNVSFMRGVPQTAYQVKVVEVVEDPKPSSESYYVAKLAFDKEVPNGEATLIFTSSTGVQWRADLYAVRLDKENKQVKTGVPTKQLRAQWPRSKDSFGPDDLRGRSVRIYSRDYPPETQGIDPTLQGISANVNTIKNQQLIKR